MKPSIDKYSVHRYLTACLSEIQLLANADTTITPGLVKLHSVLSAEPFGTLNSRLHETLLSSYTYIYDGFLASRMSHVYKRLANTIEFCTPMDDTKRYVPLTKELVDMFDSIYTGISTRYSTNIYSHNKIEDLTDKLIIDDIDTMLTMLTYHRDTLDTTCKESDIPTYGYYISDIHRKIKRLLDISHPSIYRLIMLLLDPVMGVDVYYNEDPYKYLLNLSISDVVLLCCPYTLIKHSHLFAETSGRISTVGKQYIKNIHYINQLGVM